MSRLVILGLLLDLAGAAIIGIPATRVSVWPGFRRLTHAKAKRYGMRKLHRDSELEDGEVGFSEILSTIDRNYGEVGDQVYKLTLKGRWGVGRVVMVDYRENNDGNKREPENIGGSSLVHGWIEREIERKYTKIGVSFLIVGFGLQIAYQIV